MTTDDQHVPAPPPEDLPRDLKRAFRDKDYSEVVAIIREMIARAIDEHEAVQHGDS